MAKKFNRWLRSTKGKTTLGGVAALVLIVAIVGQLLGWWAALGHLITGTVGGPVVSYPAPPGGYTCLPSCADGTTAPQDGLFLSMPGDQMASFGGESIVVWLSIPGNYSSFELSIFDGDSGKNNAGVVNYRNSNWDNTNTESTYTLYVDPLRNGQGMQVVGSWLGNASNPLSGNGWTASVETMPNNAWYTLNIQVDAAAKGPSGHYFYRLEATRPAQGGGINAFKLRSTAYLSTGQSDLVNSNFAIVAMMYGLNDAHFLYPQFQSVNNPGPSNYTGDWRFYLYLPNEEGTLEFWDGDFDVGSWNCDPNNPDPAICNTRDPLTPIELPDWANEFTVAQGTHLQGMPPDDIEFSLYRREPNVQYEIINPFGVPVYTNLHPSGSEEWKRYVISSDPATPAHYYVDKIGPGFYTWHIQGLDVFNTVWIRTNYMIAPICEDGPCPPPPPWQEGTCPRTIGYWKNNVKKVLIDNKPRGTQETRESLDWALRNVALASPLFRSGINVAAPTPIANAVRLTDQEAHAILQKAAGNTMLDRALQQNLATWLNLGSGKLGPTTVIRLEGISGGTFHGTVWEALQEAQNIILYGGNMERAKDIADMINNGQLNADPEGTIACQDYGALIPPAEQPPVYEEMPEGPLPEVPDTVPPAPTPDPATCNMRTNTYGVENPTNNPFYGIKFEYQSGTEIKNGNMDEFKITVTAAEAAAMTSVQLEAKAADFVGTLTLEGCAFNEGLPCGEPVRDADGYFAFYFMGAQDNGDGTMTLTFQVQNLTNRGLSHATIGLPAGVIPSAPGGNYQSQVCR